MRYVMAVLLMSLCLFSCRCRSSDGSARSSSGPAFARSVQSTETVAVPANPPLATRSHAHHRSPRNTPPVAPESKSQAVARVVPVAHDRRAQIIPPQTRRTWRPPANRSTAYRKDVPAPPPTPCARSRCLLVSPRHSDCSSPCANSTNDRCGSHHLLLQVPRLAPRPVRDFRADAQRGKPLHTSRIARLGSLGSYQD
jgi:hypothetical protein